MAPPTITETENLTTTMVDELVADKERELLFAHLKNVDIECDKRTSTVNLGKKLRRWIEGDDDDVKASDLLSLIQNMDMKLTEMSTTSERLEKRIMEVEKGGPRR